MRSFRREIRSGEVLVLLGAVALAVAALTAVGFPDRPYWQGSRAAGQRSARCGLATPVAGTDTGQRGANKPEEYGLETAETNTFPSVVFAGDESALATIKAVSDNYPLRGSVRIADNLFGEQRES